MQVNQIKRAPTCRNWMEVGANSDISGDLSIILMAWLVLQETQRTIHSPHQTNTSGYHQ